MVEQRIREENAYISWTGSGFLRITEGGQIQIIIDNVQTSGDYEIVLRYEPLVSKTLPQYTGANWGCLAENFAKQYKTVYQPKCMHFV